MLVQEELKSLKNSCIQIFKKILFLRINLKLFQINKKTDKPL